MLEDEIWLYKNNTLYKEKTKEFIKDNFITNYKILTKSLKETINKYKLSNLIIQNKIYIIINRLYCETNLLILKTVFYNLGFSNYKIIYEEDLYSEMNNNVLSIWKDNGIYLKNNESHYIDFNKKNNLNIIDKGALLITSNKDIISKFNKELLLYENSIDPIFKLAQEY